MKPSSINQLSLQRQTTILDSPSEPPVNPLCTFCFPFLAVPRNLDPGTQALPNSRIQPFAVEQPRSPG